ncbi:MAG: hypothetical protein ACXVIF_05175 [Halobacteriota archaeon]
MARPLTGVDRKHSSRQDQKRDILGNRRFLKTVGVLSDVLVGIFLLVILLLALALVFFLVFRLLPVLIVIAMVLLVLWFVFYRNRPRRRY